MMFPILVALALSAALAIPATANAAQVEKYAQRASIQGVADGGDHRITVTPEIYGASLTRPDLRDLRLMGPDGQEVPWLRRPVWRPGGRKPLAARVYDPVQLPDGSSQAVLDLGEGPPAHNRIALSISGHDYLRRTRIESSRDGKDFGLLTEGAYVFDVRSDGPRATRNELNYPSSQSRYLRISLLPGSDKQTLRIKAATVLGKEHIRPGTAEKSIDLPFMGPVERKEKQSIQALERLPKGVPFSSLSIQVSQGEFVRRVRVEASTQRQAWFLVGGGVIYRVKRQDAGQAVTIDENLELPISLGGRPFLRLVIDDGDDAPLEISSVQIQYRLEELIFRARSAGAHHLLLGWDEAKQPRYDLSAQLAKGGGAGPKTVSMSALIPNPDFGKDQKPKGPAPWTERNKLLLQIGVGVLALLLGVWTVLLLRRGSRKET